MNAFNLVLMIPWHIFFQENSQSPELIRLAPPVIQNSFVSIQKAVSDNAKLPLTSQSTAPLEARAEIWLMVGNPDEALKDFLAAYNILLQSKPIPSEKIRFLTKLSSFLIQFNKNPVAQHVSHSWDYFYQGKKALRGKNITQAKNYFDNAVSLNPAEPLFYFFRAMASFHLGNVDVGQRDALMGVFLERNQELPNRDRLLEELESFQGSVRVWLCETIKTQPVIFNK
jgi:hypothetical protein